MTEPVPGQTPEPAATDDAITTPPPAGEPETDEPGPAAGEPGAAGADEPQPAAANPQELFGSLSLSAIEADIDRLMSDKMSQLDGMLAGLEDLVQRLEGEITNLEAPPDESDTPKG
ncbi:hypothetical protein AB0H12_40760 [Actinosynnema sp. NPDC023794]